MQPESIWEIALSNGLYGVHVALGDPTRMNLACRLEIEGKLVAEGTTSASQRWVEADGLIVLKDGRLTLAAGGAAVTNHLCFVEIAFFNRPTLQAPFRNSIGSGNVTVLFPGEPGFRYEFQGTTNGLSWSAVGLATLARGEEFRFVDPNAPTAPGRLYRAELLTTP